MAPTAVRGTLKILIEGAKDIASIVSIGEQHPYYLLECGQHKVKSKPCRTDGRNPVWTVAHKFQLTEEMVVKVVLKDDGSKGIIGEALIDLERVRRVGREDSATPLTTLGGQQRGLLQFRLKFASESAANSPMAGNPPLSPEFGASSRNSSAPDAQPHPYAAVLGQGQGHPDAHMETASEMQDDTLRSINTKTAMAKAAMQQLNAELAELTGGSSQAPRVQGVAARSASATGSGRQPQRTSIEGPSSSAAASSSSSKAGPRHSRSVGEASYSSLASEKPLRQQQQGRSLAAENAAMSPVSVVSSGTQERLSAEELLQRYGVDTSAGGGSGAGYVQMQELLQALESAHTEKAALEDELTMVKKEMANMTSAHYHEIQRIKQTTGVGSPLSASRTVGTSAGGAPAAATSGGGAANGMQTMVKSGKAAKAAGAAAAAVGASLATLSSDKSAAGSSSHQSVPAVEGLAAAEGPASPRGLEELEDVGDWGDESEGAPGDKGGSPLAAHRLEVKVLQLERQVAAAAAKASQQEAKMAAQAEEVAALQKQLDTAKAMAQSLEANSKAADGRVADAATTLTVSKQQAAEAAQALEEAKARETALGADLSKTKVALTAALTEKAELEEALGLMDRNNTAEVARLQDALSKVQAEAEALRKGSVEVAALQARLAATAQEADGYKSTAEEVEYLQEQLRRKTRLVVELQHKLQLLESQAAPTEQAPQGSKAPTDEVELLMQELVNAKVELAEVKEQQLITQRQLYQAQAALRRAGAE